MTFATNTHHRVQAERIGFTLIELLVVIGILVLLIGILLPAVSIAYKKSVITRQRADLQAIGTGLEAYKSDFGNYPTVDTDDTGAAVLGKAMFGMYDSAKYWTGNDPEDVANATNTPPTLSTTLANPPAPYDPNHSYAAGEMMSSGSATGLSDYLQGNTANINFWVSLRDDNLNTFTSPMGPTCWARFNPFDGKNGLGFRKRLNSQTDNNGPHAASGQVYGPYLQPEKFTLSGMMIVDRYHTPILYFPTLPQTSVTTANGLVSTRANANARPWLNIYADRAPFVYGLPELPDNHLSPYARIAIALGDYNVSGAIDSGETAPPNVNFILWSAGPDKAFGPTGTHNPGSSNPHDFDNTGSNFSQNQQAAKTIDDITNLQQ